MKFLCGSCRTKYQISDEKVRGKILTIRCKKCGSKIIVRESLARDSGGSTAVAPVADAPSTVEPESRSVAPQSRSSAGSGGAALAHAFDAAMKEHGGEADDMPTSIAPVPANLDIAGVEWYVAIDGEQHGPFAFAEVVTKVSGGEIIGRHYVWHDGMEGWSRVRDVKDLAGYLPSQKKKGPPPPPPPAESTDLDEHGNVVDFEQKRAERQRQQSLGASAVAPMDADLEQTEVESPDAGALAGATTSDRAEQLDDVLNEALGIEGEGKTARAEPEKAVAMAGVAQAGAGSSIDELLSFDDNQEDIFANVPRASDEPEDPQRESTRFFVAAAGVNRQKSKNRMAMLLGLIMVLGLLGFIGAWAQGIIEIKIPGIGNPFAKSETAKTDELADLDTSGVEDIDALKKQLDGVKDPNRRRAIVRETRRKQRRVVPSEPTAGLEIPGDYVDDSESAGSDGVARRRGDRVDDIQYETNIGTGGGAKSMNVGDSNLPGSGIENVPPPDQKTLDQAAIARVINARKKSVSICYEQSLRGREDLRGKLEFLVTVQPSGEVSRVAVETTAFKGSKLGSCIADKIRDWRFPRFEGEAQQVVVPFVLEKHSY